MSILVGEEKDEKTGVIKAVYSKELILDGVTAYEVMIKWIGIYFNGNWDSHIGEVFTRMHFMQGDFVDSQECWDLWEKCVKEALENKNKK